MKLTGSWQGTNRSQPCATLDTDRAKPLTYSVGGFVVSGFFFGGCKSCVRSGEDSASRIRPRPAFVPAIVSISPVNGLRRVRTPDLPLLPLFPLLMADEVSRKSIEVGEVYRVVDMKPDVTDVEGDQVTPSLVVDGRRG